MARDPHPVDSMLSEAPSGSLAGRMAEHGYAPDGTPLDTVDLRDDATRDRCLQRAATALDDAIGELVMLDGWRMEMAYAFTDWALSLVRRESP